MKADYQIRFGQLVSEVADNLHDLRQKLTSIASQKVRSDEPVTKEERSEEIRFVPHFAAGSKVLGS